MSDREKLKCRLLALTEKVPAEDRWGVMERLVTICERISAMKYGRIDSEPEHTITRKLCNRDAGWLAEYVLQLLRDSQ